MADRITRAARAERRRAEEALRSHLHICLSCNRQSKGIPENEAVRCDTGWQLTRHLDLMTRQEGLLTGPDSEWIQEGLF
jgi:hypothetical protein